MTDIDTLKPLVMAAFAQKIKEHVADGEYVAKCAAETGETLSYSDQLTLPPKCDFRDTGIRRVGIGVYPEYAPDDETVVENGFERETVRINQYKRVRFRLSPDDVKALLAGERCRTITRVAGSFMRYLCRAGNATGRLVVRTMVCGWFPADVERFTETVTLGDGLHRDFPITMLVKGDGEHAVWEFPIFYGTGEEAKEQAA